MSFEEIINDERSFTYGRHEKNTRQHKRTGQNQNETKHSHLCPTIPTNPFQTHLRDLTNEKRKLIKIMITIYSLGKLFLSISTMLIISCRLSFSFRASCSASKESKARNCEGVEVRQDTLDSSSKANFLISNLP